MGTELRRRIRRLLALAFAAGWCAGGHAAEGAGGAPTEYEVKAAFLFNFAKFVMWPPQAFEAPDAPLLIGVLGEDPFGVQLARLAADVRVQGHPLQIIHGATAAQVAQCHVVFVSTSERERLRPDLESLRAAHSPALTVGDDGLPEFLSAGGMILFVREEKKLRFEISQPAAARAGLAISSKLLTLARNTRHG